MNIIEAAKELDKGKKIEGGNATCPLFKHRDEIFFADPMGGSSAYHMDTIDLLADDWEIVP